MSSCVIWDLSRLGICRLWRDRFKDLFPTLFLMSLGSSPSFFLHPNVEETGANEPMPSSGPFSLSCAWCSQILFVQEKSREKLEGITWILRGWFSAVREVGLGGNRLCFVSGCAWKFRKEKSGGDLLRQKRSFKNKVEIKRFLGPEGCWAFLGLQKNTCPS